MVEAQCGMCAVQLQGVNIAWGMIYILHAVLACEGIIYSRYRVNQSTKGKWRARRTSTASYCFHPQHSCHQVLPLVLQVTSNLLTLDSELNVGTLTESYMHTSLTQPPPPAPVELCDRGKAFALHVSTEVHSLGRVFKYCTDGYVILQNVRLWIILTRPFGCNRKEWVA